MTGGNKYMFDFIIARFLYRLADLITILEGENYRSKAFYRAALAIDGYGKNVYNLYLRKEISNIPGVGNKIEKYILEIIETNKLSELLKLQGSMPDTIYDIISLPDLNNKVKKEIIEKAIYNIEQLKDANYLKTKKFSSSVIEKIRAAIEKYEKEYGKYQFGHAFVIGEEVLDYFKSKDEVLKVDLVGALRRKDELVSTIEVLVCSNNLNKLKEGIDSCSLLSNMKLSDGQIYEGKTYLNIPIRIYLISNDLYYFNLFKLTGPAFYVEKILNKDNFNEQKVLGCQTEEEVFLKLGEKYVIPELRYNKKLFRKNLINEEDYKGDLHAHTNWSDGINSLEELREEGERLGFQYLSICDHSISLKVGNGLSNEELLKQIKNIKKTNSKNKKTKVLAGIEVDIRKDGTLDYPDYILSQLDFVVASIHTSFNQSKEEMMRRLRKALSNKYVNILAHPTGRLLGRPGRIFGRRKGLNLDYDELLNICKENDVALEINAFPERFDLNKELATQAIKKGVKLSIGTDAHATSNLSFYKYGIFIAKGAGARKNDVLNTYSYQKLKNYFRLKKDKDLKEKKHDIYCGMKDFNYYFGNNNEIINGQKTVVGIDLTGSNKKATGWSYLKKNKVLTKLLVTDEEIIKETIKYKPDVISIDSPLSIPAGRCCTKEDCECRKLGIIRYCEKTLMRMGIGVFPCLLPSMVGLTERGMRLAKKFREKGFEVIESYPGVAQDILNINRKNRGLNNLIRGLTIFGIIGDINKTSIVHDEVDAITSALVGYFYLNNQYIPLGIEAENYLIIPRISSDILNKPMIIGIAGEAFAGKTILAEYLRFKYGFKYLMFDNNEIISLLEKGMADEYSYVIKGVDNFLKFETFKNIFTNKFILIFIDTSYQNRTKRCNNTKGDDLLKEDNKNNDTIELAFLADYRLSNNKSFIDMFNQVDSVIIDIMNKR